MNAPASTAGQATIVTRLTAQIPSAIATIGVQGPRAVEVVLAHAKTRAKELRIGRIHYGTWRWAGDPTVSGEQIVLCRQADDLVELHCHGGNAVCNVILGDLQKAGCALVSQRDWPSQFACPIARAAEQDLIQATTDRAAAVLLDQLCGALASSIEQVIQAVESGRSDLAESQLEQLDRWSDFGLHLTEPWQVVLAGPPNVGKSSLVNAIVGSLRAIVHHEPGTTRDWLEAQTAVDGWPVALNDTAGIRSSDDALESEGVDRALGRVRQADLVVLVVDACRGWTDVHTNLIASLPERQLLAWNKSDLSSLEPDGFPGDWKPIRTSTVGRPGVTDLIAEIGSQLVPRSPPENTAVPFRHEHGQAVALALEAIKSGRHAEAVAQLRMLLAPSWSGKPQRS